MLVSLCCSCTASVCILITSHSGTTVPECIKDDSESQWDQWKRGEIRPPLPQKPLNRWSPNLAWVMMSGTPTPVKKFHHDPIRGFCTPPPRPSAGASAYKVTRLVSFFGFFLFSTAKTPAPIFTINTSNDVVSRKDVPFRGPENKILHFDPHFPQKPQILGKF